MKVIGYNSMELVVRYMYAKATKYQYYAWFSVPLLCFREKLKCSSSSSLSSSSWIFYLLKARH